ncbi:MAG: hypothetical protein AAF441_21610 [Pseudomonadota bacterium]
MTGTSADSSASHQTLKSYALEVVAERSAEALLRVLNPLQKLEITPQEVRSGRAPGGEGMFIEIQFDATPERAGQVRRQVGSSILVQDAQLLSCSR